MHPKRAYHVEAVESVALLAEMLADHRWCLCQAFRVGDLLVANDSFTAEGAQEWVVVRDDVERESLAVSRMGIDALTLALFDCRTSDADYGDAHLVIARAACPCDGAA